MPGDDKMALVVPTALEVFHWQQQVSWGFSCLELSGFFLELFVGPWLAEGSSGVASAGVAGEESNLRGCWSLEAWGLGGHSCWSA